MASDFKPRREGVAGVREKRCEQGREEVKLMFHRREEGQPQWKCEEGKWVDLPNEFEKFGKHAQLKRCWMSRMREAASGWADDYVKKLANDGFVRGR